MEVKGSQDNKPPLGRNENERMNEGSSYITAISILGFVVGFLFLVKWIYVSRRRKSQRDALQSIWRDEFSVSSLPLWDRERSLKSKKYVRSALLVGLFGSPAWETRYYSAHITDKVSGSRSQSGWQDSFAAKESARYKSLFVKSDRNVSVNCTETHRGTEDALHLVHHLRADSHKSGAFLTTPELSLPSPVMEFDSGTKRSRHSENVNSPRIMCWKNGISLRKHSSYPSGVWFETWSGGPTGDTKGPRVEPSLMPFSSVLSCSKDVVPENTDPQTGDIPRCLVSIEKEVALQSPQYPNYSQPMLDLDSTSHLSKNAMFDAGKKGLNVLLSGDPMHLENQSSLQAASFWMPNVSPFTVTDDEFNALNNSHGEKGQSSNHVRSALPLKERLSSRSPKIGPSPLRRMFFPADDTEVDETDNTTTLPSFMTGSNSNTQCHPWAQVFQEAMDPFPTNPATLEIQVDQLRDMTFTGLGISSSVVKPTYSMPPTQRLLLAKQPQRTDRDTNLLGFLEELVQETSEWAPDMFLDNNFKVMIDSSKSYGVYTPTRAHRRKSAPSRKHRMSHIFLEDIPEVDITENSDSPKADKDDRSYWSDDDVADREVGIAR